MRKIILLITIVCLMTGCGNPIIPLRGDYSKVERTFVSAYSKEETWSRLIDVMVIAEIPINIIDKSSGLLVSQPVDMTKNATYEDNQGRVINAKMALVTSKYQYKAMSIPLHPQVITGTWNIRMVEANNALMVTINLINAKAITVANGLGDAYSQTIAYDVKSTGTFEKIIKSRISF